MGQVSVENTFQHDIFGTHVNRASRIESIAGAGQILTSQSVWENASAWLKGGELQGVSSRNCGKARLKGVKEPIQLYEFFFEDRGPMPIPHAIKLDKRRRVMFAASVGLIVLITVAILFTRMPKRWESRQVQNGTGQPDTIFFAGVVVTAGGDPGMEWFRTAYRIYSVKEDSYIFVPLSSPSRHTLEEEILSSLISATYPEYVLVREDDLKQMFNRKGVLAPSYLDSLGDLSNMRRSMNSAGIRRGIIVRAKELHPPILKDSLAAMVTVDEKGGWAMFAAVGRNTLDLAEKIASEYRDFLTKERKHKQHGTILSFAGEEGIMRFDQGMLIRKGAILSVSRHYYSRYWDRMDSAVQKRLSDLEELKAGFDSDQLWKESKKGYFWSLDEYEDICRDRIRFRGDGGMETGMGIDMRVDEVYDSTAVVMVIKQEIPHIQVRAGDMLYMK